MRIITLGTGAGRPTLKRAASAVGLEYEGKTFLFDCGEGTQLQLMKSPFHWGKMSAVFISHLHGDHVNGLPGLLGTLSLSDRAEELSVFGPKGLKKILDAYRDCNTMNLRYPLKIHEIKKPGVLWSEEMFQVVAAPLDHVIPNWGYRFEESTRPGTFDAAKAAALGLPDGPIRARLVRGGAVTLPDGRKIPPDDLVGPSRPGRHFAHCLDTRYGKMAVDFARDSDLLLHEATFHHAMQEEASKWGHSTAADAARVARDADVGQLLLTHISQRYGDAEELLAEAKEIFPRVAVASDLEVFSVTQDRTGPPKGQKVSL